MFLHNNNECSPTVSAKLTKRYHILTFKRVTLAEVKSNLKPQTNNPQEAASSSSVASQRFYDNILITEDTESQQEEHYANIERKEETPA